jgi:exodeoxyribonuclease VII large subunit
MDPFHNAANLKSSEKTQSNEVYSVTEYIALINIRLKPLRAIIQGEIAEVKYSQKAVYFNLRDKGGATISCLVWLSRLASLGIDPKDGMEVKVQGYPDVYPQYGKLTFKVDVITPIGEGALRLAFEKLKKDLESQGYFRPERNAVYPGISSGSD